MRVSLGRIRSLIKEALENSVEEQKVIEAVDDVLAAAAHSIGSKLSPGGTYGDNEPHIEIVVYAGDAGSFGMTVGVEVGAVGTAGEKIGVAFDDFTAALGNRVIGFGEDLEKDIHPSNYGTQEDDYEYLEAFKLNGRTTDPGNTVIGAIADWREKGGRLSQPIRREVRLPASGSISVQMAGSGKKISLMSRERFESLKKSDPELADMITRFKDLSTAEQKDVISRVRSAAPQLSDRS